MTRAINKKCAKVYFVPNYYHLNFDFFLDIASHLPDKLATFLDIPANKMNNKPSLVQKKLLNEKKIDIEKIRVHIMQSYDKSLAHRAYFLICCIKNFILIDKWIKTANPQIIVTGSDLGNLQVRFLLGLSMYYEIPIMVVFTTEFIRPEKKQSSCFGTLFDQLIFDNKLLVFFRSLFFRGQVPGTYAQTSKLYVISHAIKESLISCGIQSSRIRVIGMNESIQKYYLPEEVKIPRCKKTILFVSQHIDNLYGNEYIKAVAEKMHEVFMKLSEVFVIIKLHPLDSLEIEEYYRSNFIGEKFLIIRDCSAETFFEVSDLIISFYSRVLIKAAIARKTFLSINWTNDRQRTFLLESEAEILEITNPDDTYLKIFNAVNNKNYQLKMREEINKVVLRYTIGKDPSRYLYEDILAVLNIEECS